MNRKQQQKLIGATCLVILVSIAVSLVLYALKQNINLFYTPTQLFQTQIKPDQTIRVGGYVKKNSVHYDATGESVSFVVTDRKNDLIANYNGVLPNLFREGQTVVVTGKLNMQHVLSADQVLAKHDERYMPRSLAKELKKGEDHAA